MGSVFRGRASVAMVGCVAVWLGCHAALGSSLLPSAFLVCEGGRVDVAPPLLRWVPS